MPSVVLELGSPHQLSWGTTAFLALSIPGSASAGYPEGAVRRAPRPDRRRLPSSSPSNLLGFASPNMEIFLLSRAVQGLGEGMVLALCYILVGDSLEPREVSPAFAILAVVWALATLIGPWLAGSADRVASWRFAFAPAAGAVGGFLWLVAHRSKPPAARRMPAAKAGAAARPAGHHRAHHRRRLLRRGQPRSDPSPRSLIALTLLLHRLCFRIDRRERGAALPGRICSRFGEPATLGIWILALMFGAEAAAPLYIAYFVQIGHGTSVFFAGQYRGHHRAFLVGRGDRHRPRRPRTGRNMIVLGPALLTLGLAVLVFWHDLPLAVSAIALASLGIGFGISYGFITEHVIGLRRRDRARRHRRRDPDLGEHLRRLRGGDLGPAGQCRGLRRRGRGRHPGRGADHRLWRQRRLVPAGTRRRLPLPPPRDRGGTLRSHEALVNFPSPAL